MVKRIVGGVAGVLVCATAAAASAQGPDTLSPQDYIEINQLYGLYSYAFDSNNGEQFASMFTADGEFVTPTQTFRGREELASLATSRGAIRERPMLFQITTNVVIGAAHFGATGSAYVLLVDLAQSPAITGGGVYEDQIVRTSNGWRFKRRAYYPQTPTAIQP